MRSLGNFNTGGPIKINRENEFSDLDDQKRKLETLLRNTSESKQKLKIKIVASRDRLNSIDAGGRPPMPNSRLNHSVVDTN